MLTSVNRPRVLVVDDEENISFLVASALRLADMDVAIAATGRDALTSAEQFDPDVIVLDVMLPDTDGFTVLQQLRSRGHLMPVLFLTARDETADRVRGLTSGGDDYITKPFALEELVARVQVALRRRGVASANSAVLQVADLILDDDAHRVTRGGKTVRLTPTEYKLCRLLMTNAGRVVSRGQILDHVWEYNFDGESAIIETFVSSLRKKIDSAEPKLVETIRGIGYTIREPE
ncbi:MAG: response regulator transcription factor [Actinobacteria bacterium]|nr:response regulator transcription factor [Actinomycetota bacterium]